MRINTSQCDVTHQLINIAADPCDSHLPYSKMAEGSKYNLCGEMCVCVRGVGDGVGKIL